MDFPWIFHGAIIEIYDNPIYTHFCSYGRLTCVSACFLDNDLMRYRTAFESMEKLWMFHGVGLP